LVCCANKNLATLVFSNFLVSGPAERKVAMVMPYSGPQEDIGNSEEDPLAIVDANLVRNIF
jgi:hypothetical protein